MNNVIILYGMILHTRQINNFITIYLKHIIFYKKVSLILILKCVHYKTKTIQLLYLILTRSTFIVLS